jgi:hypothetical protein
MHTGHIISGAGHAAFFLWALFGGVSMPDEPTVEVTDVALVSPEEFAALTPAEIPPGATTEVSDLPQPAPAETAPPETPAADTPPEQAQPEVTEAPATEPAPEAPDLTTPQAEVADAAPEITPPAENTTEDTAVLLPDTPAEAPRNIPRVAPRPVMRPNPDTSVAETPQAPTAPAEQAEEVKPAEEEKAPEEATTRIVTEADDKGDGPPKSSKRPPAARPVRTAAAEPKPDPKPAEKLADKPAEKPAPKPADQKDAVADALAKALAGGSTPTTEPPSGVEGPPMTSGEKEALRVAVSACWNTGSLSTDALRTTVVVSVAMSEDGRPKTETIEMVGASGGSGDAARQAFEAARRAIIRCGANGFGLPVDKYDTWREIEMTFNPEKMRIK